MHEENSCLRYILMFHAWSLRLTHSVTAAIALAFFPFLVVRVMGCCIKEMLFTLFSVRSSSSTMVILESLCCLRGQLLLFSLFQGLYPAQTGKLVRSACSEQNWNDVILLNGVCKGYRKSEEWFSVTFSGLCSSPCPWESLKELQALIVCLMIWPPL